MAERRGGAQRRVDHWCTIRDGAPMSTRKLIVAALVCGLVILVAFALQVTLATR